MKKVALFPTIAVLLCTGAYVFGTLHIFNVISSLSSKLETLQVLQKDEETKIKSAQSADPESLTREEVKVVKKIYHKLMRRCDMWSEKLDAIKVMQRLVANDTTGAKDKFLELRRPKVHVTARQNHTVHSNKGARKVTYWKHDNHGENKTFKCYFNLTNSKIRVSKEGRYYLYSQVKFEYKRHQTPSLHRHSIKIIPGGTSLDTTVFESCYYLGNEKGDEKYGTKVSNQGAVLHLNKGDELYVEADTGRHSKLVAKCDADTFFGMYMVT